MLDAVCAWRLVVGLTEITPQYSGMFLANSAVPICVAVSMMSCLWLAISGRSTSMSVAESITARLVRVWLDTWLMRLAGNQRLDLQLLGNTGGGAQHHALEDHAHLAVVDLAEISPTTSSNGTLMNEHARCERPNFCQNVMRHFHHTQLMGTAAEIEEDRSSWPAATHHLGRRPR